MKVTWGAEDVKCGQIFGLPSTSERGIIDYDPTMQDKHAGFMLVSLADGMIICPPTTKFLIAKKLNDGDYLPIELLELLEAAKQGGAS